jgi:hypothetical protein
LVFEKDWIGKVEQFEVRGEQNLWLRLVLNDPIPNTAGTGTLVDTIALKIESVDPPKGNTSIERAFHNNTPLPLTTSFLPFGPEPQRFDTFSLAAPEVFSKKGANATLDMVLADASLVALCVATMTAPVTKSVAAVPLRLYGIGSNGRLQVIEFANYVRKSWLEVPHPDAVPQGLSQGVATTGGISLQLAAAKPPQAVQIAGADSAPVDLVIAWDKADRLWARSVQARAVQAPAKWLFVPAIAQDTKAKDVVLVSAGPGSTHAAFLIAVSEDGLYALGVTAAGTLDAAWTEFVSSGPEPHYSEKMLLVPVHDGTWPRLPKGAPTDLVLIAGQQPRVAGSADNNKHILYQGSFRLPVAGTAGLAIWTRLHDAAGEVSAAPTIRPFAAQSGKEVVIAAADATRDLFVLTGQWNALTRHDPSTGLPKIAEETAIGCTPFFKDDEDSSGIDSDSVPEGPIVTAFGETQGGFAAIVWVKLSKFETFPLADDSLPGVRPAAVLVPRSRGGLEPPFLAIGGVDESLMRGEFRDRTEAELFDRLHLKLHAARPAFVELKDKQTRIVRLGDAVLSNAGLDQKYYAVRRASPQLTGEATYQFWKPKKKDTEELTGTVVDTETLRLNENDEVTQEGDFLIVTVDDNFSRHEVTALPKQDSPTDEALASLKPPLVGAGKSVKYLTVAIVKNQGEDTTQLLKSDLAGLAHSSAESPTYTVVRSLAGGEVQRKITNGVAASPPPIWRMLDGEWPDIPADSLASVVGDLHFDGFSIEQLDRGYQNPELSWEYFDGRGWQRLRISKDETQNFASSGKIEFKVPLDLSPVDVAGQNGYFIRAQLVGGTYGQARYIVTTEGYPPKTTQSIEVNTDDLHPPEILSVTASFSLDDEVPPETVVVENNGAILNQTQAAIEPNARFELFEGLFALDRFGKQTALQGRVLLLGFTRRFDVNPLTLYADAEEQEGKETLRAAVLTQKGWRDVTVKDQTFSLRRRGFVRVFISEPPVQAALLGEELYWLLLSPRPAADDTSPAAEWNPRIKGLYVNAVLAEEAKTIEQELLGSSVGEPKQTYQLSGKPVLLREMPSVPAGAPVPPPDVEIRVRESLSDEERAELEATAAGTKAVLNPDDLPGDWVLWRRSDTFVGTDGDARVFKLDPNEGIVTFGDGRQGKIPPAGTDGVRAFRYQQGGGERGNVAAYTIKGLKTALESVEAVTNPVEASGGIDAPGVDRIVAAAPTILRHANRALSASDIEAFALASSSDVVRARHLGPQHASDPMRLVIAVRTGEPCPRPSLARRDALARYILEHAAGALDTDALEVVAPEYVRLRVEVQVFVTSAEVASEVEDTVRKRLIAFLHPTDGGPEGDGWAFGRRVWPSDIYRVVSAIEGVDRVASAVVKAADSAADLDHLAPTALICVEESEIKVHVKAGATP